MSNVPKLFIFVLGIILFFGIATASPEFRETVVTILQAARGK